VKDRRGPDAGPLFYWGKDYFEPVQILIFIKTEERGDYHDRLFRLYISQETSISELLPFAIVMMILLLFLIRISISLSDIPL